MSSGILNYFSGQTDPMAENMLKGCMTGWMMADLQMSARNNQQETSSGSPDDDQIKMLKGHLEKIKEGFRLNDPFPVKLSKLDNFIAANKDLKDISELLVDLLFFNYYQTNPFTKNNKFEETAEWKEIEETLENRGTLMFDLFMYLAVNRKTNVKVTLEDFLDKFLLINDPEFATEAENYRNIISSIDLITEHPSTIVEASEAIKDTSHEEMPFIPIMFFFHREEDLPVKINFIQNLPLLHPFTLAAYFAVLSGYHGYNRLPENMQWI